MTGRVPIARLFPLLGLVLLVAVGCTDREYVLIGKTMGTTYQVTVVSRRPPEGLKARIDYRLAEINRSMSTYQPDSEIRRLNRRPAGEPMTVSEDFFRVLTAAAEVYRLSGGAWDPTVDPLVTLWGFGRSAPRLDVPPPEAIQRAMASVGFEAIRRTPPRRVSRVRADVSLDLGSIAKGYGVDRISALLTAHGYERHLVEIGGEVRAAGRRANGTRWRVGISTPSPTAGPDSIHRVISLEDRAMATSGDYRSFFTADGKRYSHIIDPRTGYPVANGVVSVSVIAPDCTLADGLATAVMVLGAGDGLALIETLDRVDALLVVRDGDRGFRDRSSSGFPAMP